jgi:hypothetical protein
VTGLGGPVALLLVAILGAGCADRQEQYCGAVGDHQEQLGEVLASGGDAALLEALAPFRELAHEAPTDIEDEWSLVIDRIEALGNALAAAGVDPATYDAERPPTGLDDAEKTAITDAARDLGAQETQRALADLEQQALDVCQTPLVL